MKTYEIQKYTDHAKKKSRSLLRIWIAYLVVLPSVCLAQVGVTTFKNPLLSSGPDPYVFFKDGYYYYTHTQGNKISIWKTTNMASISTAPVKTIWTAPKEKLAYSREIWAPEILFIKDKWYVYFSADDGNNNNHRIYVLENTSKDPTNGDWVFKGKLPLPEDRWAIDADLFEYKDKWYVTWSGWEGNVNGQQNIYIAEMITPLQPSQQRICISKPSYSWEKYGDLKPNEVPSHLNVNEGPQGLVHANNLFIVYSASACWTDTYALGLLSLQGGNPLDSTKWTKSQQPVFQQSPQNGVYATGHNSFFKSIDGKEDWILYHANSKPSEGCGNKRSPRMQQFTWDNSGSPVFGIPVAENTELAIPSK